MEKDKMVGENFDDVANIDKVDKVAGVENVVPDVLGAKSVKIGEKGKLDFVSFLCDWNKKLEMRVPEHHIRMAKWLAELYYSDKRRGLLMAFRSSGKSTIVGVFCAWLLYMNPNLRILVVAADTMLARKMVRNVRRIIELNPLLHSICPKKKSEWAAGSFTVQRDLELRDPSMLAVGLMSNAVGSRADVIIYDDVEVPKTCSTHQKRVELREKLLEYNFILVPDGLQLFIGTPHVVESIYKTKKIP